VLHDPVDLIAFLMKAVKTEFVLNPEQDEETASQSGSQSEYVDKRVPFVIPEIPNGNFQIVFKHDEAPEQ
jgi:hypothetical protein